MMLRQIRREKTVYKIQMHVFHYDHIYIIDGSITGGVGGVSLYRCMCITCWNEVDCCVQDHLGL